MMSRTRARPLVRKLISTRAAVLFAVGCAFAGTAASISRRQPHGCVSRRGEHIYLCRSLHAAKTRIRGQYLRGCHRGRHPTAHGLGGRGGRECHGGRRMARASLRLGWLQRWGLALCGAPIRLAVSPLHGSLLGSGRSTRLPGCGCCAGSTRRVTRGRRCVTALSCSPVHWLVRSQRNRVELCGNELARQPVVVARGCEILEARGPQGSARGLFWASVWHLPAVMVLALLQKRGMWQRVWKSVAGEPEEDDDEWEYVDEESSE